jgi:hypothetical protein
MMVWYTLEQRVITYDSHVKQRSAREGRRAFRAERVPSRQTIHNLENNLINGTLNRLETKTKAPSAY